MKILIASGGSGGHVFPAVSLANELKTKGHDIVFVASRRKLDRNILKNENYTKAFLSANPMPYKLGFRSVVFISKLILDAICALFILLRHRPRVAVGFGGYTGGAILLLASITGVKTIIHEQNLVPGRTNRMLDRFASGVAISFRDTKKYFKNRNIKFTGNPLRRESLEFAGKDAFHNLKLNEGTFTILVMGGSQGAKTLNDLVSQSVSMLPEDIKKKSQMLHIAGPQKASFLEESYRKNRVHGKVFDFIQKINEAYSVCDLAISRAGAAAIFELAAFKKAMILIPYPYSKNNQRFNAEFFAENGAAIYKKESDTTAEELKNVIEELVNDVDKRKALGENAIKLSVRDGASRLAQFALEGAL